MIVKALVGLAFLTAVMVAATFGFAGTLHAWRAWLAIATFSAGNLAVTIDLARRDRALLARRTQIGVVSEPRLGQKLGQAGASLAFVAMFAIAGLDIRYGWSCVPAWLSIAGDLMIAIGLAVVARVFRENTYTSATVEVAAEQRVIASGPYAIVRHPMYAAAFLLLVGVPVALGTWWSYVAVAATVAVIVWRLLDEERLLVAKLPGYVDYRAAVRWRLVPRIW